MKRIHIIFLAFFATIYLHGSKVVAAEATDVSSLLWVGNSFFYYNNSMHNFVSGFGRADGLENIRGTSITISGSGLDWHDMSSYLRPDGVGRYSFVGDNEIVFNKGTRQYDGVIMMDCSQCPIHPQLAPIFFKFVKQNAKIIRDAEATPILFMSWAYKDKPEMTAQLAEAYSLAGKESNILVVPAGIAFANSVKDRPNLELYQNDKRHPTVAGTYLAAATVYATVYKKNPVGNKFTSSLDRDTAAFLQTIAWKTAQDYANQK